MTATPPPEADMRRIVGRYRLEQELGRGAMGTVWSAYDEVLHRPVAVKEVRLSMVPVSERAVVRERTLREARATAMLSHPNVVTLYDVVEVDAEPYVVMELLPPRSLASYIIEHGTLAQPEVAEIGSAVASALSAAHRAGITHRDVKPGNVLIGENGQIKLTDFGIARNAAESSMTQTGTVLGSPPYIAPEVAMGRTVGPAADLWGLGATLFACLEGRPPYDGGDPVATVSAVVHGEIPVPAGRGPVVEVIRGLMVKEPANRMALATVRRRLRPLLADPEGPVLSAPSSAVTTTFPRPAVDGADHSGLIPLAADGRGPSGTLVEGAPPAPVPTPAGDDAAGGAAAGATPAAQPDTEPPATEPPSADDSGSLVLGAAAAPSPTTDEPAPEDAPADGDATPADDADPAGTGDAAAGEDGPEPADDTPAEDEPADDADGADEKAGDAEEPVDDADDGADVSAAAVGVAAVAGVAGAAAVSSTSGKDTEADEDSDDAPGADDGADAAPEAEVAPTPAKATPAKATPAKAGADPDAAEPEVTPKTPTPETPAAKPATPETSPATKPSTPEPGSTAETPAPETPSPGTPAPETPAPETPSPETGPDDDAAGAKPAASVAASSAAQAAASAAAKAEEPEGGTARSTAKPTPKPSPSARSAGSSRADGGERTTTPESDAETSMVGWRIDPGADPGRRPPRPTPRPPSRPPGTPVPPAARPAPDPRARSDRWGPPGPGPSTPSSGWAPGRRPAPGVPAANQPLAADPGPLPFTPTPASEGSGRRRLVVVAVVVLLVLVAALGALGGYALTRTLAGQPALALALVPAGPVISGTRLVQHADTDARYSGTGLGFSSLVPAGWQQFRLQEPTNDVVVRFVSPGADRELRVDRLTGFYPAQRASSYVELLADPARVGAEQSAVGTVSAVGPASAGAPEPVQQLVYRTRSGTDDRTTWTRLVPRGTDLWVLRLTAPTGADAGAPDQFVAIAESFAPQV